MAGRPIRIAMLLALVLATIATASGLRAQGGEFDDPLSGGAWESFANGDRIQRLLREGDTVWAATDGGGVVRWSIESGEHRQYLAPQDGLHSNLVSDLARTQDGQLWAATDRGLARFNPDSDRFETLAPYESAGMPSRVVRALAPTPDGRLWVGFAQEWDRTLPHEASQTLGSFTKGGLALYDPSEDRWVAEHHVKLVTEGRNIRYETLPSENITRLAFASDGILWIGSKPYQVWDRSACGDDNCKPTDGAWVQAGGGLAAYSGSAWSTWIATDASASCYPSQVTDLAADVGGRMWVGTVGRGVLMMQGGMAVRGCSAGMVYYSRPKRAGIDGGLRGNTAWSVNVAPDGRVWIGTGDGIRKGAGIAILDHRNTFNDSTACDCQGDDRWDYIDFDGLPGESDISVTALLTGDADRVIMGTRDHRGGDGEGLRVYRPESTTWTAFRTAATGLPGNRISALRRNPVTGHLWASFNGRGVAVFDGLRWRSWRLFGGNEKVGQVNLDARAGYALVAVDIPDRASFDARFPVQPATVRVGDHPIVYTVKQYKPPAGNSPAYLELSPGTIQAVAKGMPILRVDRGPTSDHASQIAFDADGGVWVGGRESIWMGENCPRERRASNECWLDGGLGHWDGQYWRTFDENTSDVPDQEVAAVEVDKTGKIWVGTGDGKSEGNGLGVLDPASGRWTLYDRAKMTGTNKPASNGIADLSVDPQSGDVWIAHHAVVEFKQNLGGSVDRRYVGGGVSRWNGSTWSTWTRKAGAKFQAFGADGEIASILADRGSDRLWIGSWTADDNFHWLQGIGVNAALSWCPLDDCRNDNWQSKIWPADGRVTALENDDQGRLWVGTNREASGLVPAVAGVKLLAGESWRTYNSENSDLPSSEITSLAADGKSMWVGSLYSGIARYAPAVPPTPTNTRRPSTLEPSPTPRPLDTLTPVPASPTTTLTPTPFGRCGAGRPCKLWLPMVALHAACLGGCPIPTATPLPTSPPAQSPTAGPSPLPATAIPPTTATAMPTSTVAPSATALPSATSLPSATAEPSASPTATQTLTPTTTPPASATATASASPTADIAAIGTWTVFEPPPLARLPKETLYDVDGVSPNSVWMVGAKGTALFWDGKELLVETLPTQETLRRVQMISERQGFIVGDNGTVFEMRSGRWVRSNTNGVVDDWRAVSVINTPDGLRGWILGAGRGNRLFFNGSSWNTTSPDDRNTSHNYSGVAMIDPTRAVSIQSSGGGRLYDWNGERWMPGTSVGPMRDVHVLSPTAGVMGGDNGSVYLLGESGQWSALASKPVTRGTPIFSMHMLRPDRIYASAGQSALFAWDGQTWQTQRIIGQNRDINGVWVDRTASSGWAVGSDGLLIRYSAP